MITERYRVSFRGDENAPKLTVRWLHTSVNVLKTTECMLKWVDSGICKLYFNKAIILKSKVI